MNSTNVALVPLEPCSDHMRWVMGRFVTGVAVVLCDQPEGPQGLTVNSFTSLSLEPPLILFCAKNGSRAAAVILQTGVFSVNILSADQRILSSHFAGRRDPRLHLDFERVREFVWLRGSNAVLCCRVVNAYPGGDHRIVIGQVETVFAPEQRAPALLYVGGAYACLPDTHFEPQA